MSLVVESPETRRTKADLRRVLRELDDVTAKLWDEVARRREERAAEDDDRGEREL